MDSLKLDKIKYALTLRAIHVPPVLEEMQELCGCIPKRETMVSDFENCGHDDLLGFWEKMIQKYPEARLLADTVWEGYVQHREELKNPEYRSPKQVGPELHPLCQVCDFLGQGKCQELECWLAPKK